MHRSAFRTVVTLSLILFVSGAVADDREGNTKSGEGSPVYELRTYTTAPGRLPDLHKRFREHTMKLFKKHGITNVLYFTPLDQENTLVYLLKHDSAAAAKKSWAAFRDDPEWQRVFKESRRDGPIVIKVERRFLKTTDYSPK